MAYAWPGNVRALRHAVERAVILGEGELLTEADFPLVGGHVAGEPLSRLDDVEKAAIARATRTAWRQCRVARPAALGLTRTSALPADGEIWPLTVFMPARRFVWRGYSPRRFCFPYVAIRTDCVSSSRWDCSPWPCWVRTMMLIHFATR